jgi:hypothetical protein
VNDTPGLMDMVQWGKQCRYDNVNKNNWTLVMEFKYSTSICCNGWIHKLQLDIIVYTIIFSSLSQYSVGFKLTIVAIV